jgi:hypothetical protein
MTDPAARYILENLTLQEATIATQALGKHVIDEQCTCQSDCICNRCLAFFMDGPIEAYEKAIAEEARKVWQEHVREA